MLSAFHFFKSRGQYSRLLLVILLFTDLLSFLFAFKTLKLFVAASIVATFSAYAFITVLSWMITVCRYQLFSHHQVSSVKTIVDKHLQALPMLVLFQLLIFSCLRLNTELIIPALAYDLYALTLTILFKSCLLMLYKQMRQRYKNRYVIVGYTTIGKRLQQYLQLEKRFGYQFMGFFEDNPDDPAAVTGSINDLYEFCIRNGVDHIYLALHHDPELTSRLAAFADDHFIHFGYVMDRPTLMPDERLSTAKTHLIPLSAFETPFKTKLI